MDGGQDDCVGGSNKNDGGAYDPTSDSWVPVAGNGDSNDGIVRTAVWTGRSMIPVGWMAICPCRFTTRSPNAGLASALMAHPNQAWPHGGVDWTGDDRLGRSGRWAYRPE